MRSTHVLGCLISLLLCVFVQAEDSGVQMASHVAAPPSRAEVIRFKPATTTVGEHVVQRVGMELSIHTVMKQAGKIAHDSQTNMRSRQQREIEVLEVVDGKAVRARVHYPLSRRMSPENADPADEIAQVVEGKSYFIARSGDRLLVTDMDGAIPPRQEYDIVVSSMESFGQPNLLAEFLLSQELHLGDRLQVPGDVAKKMMGFDTLGTVQKFELYLQEVKDIGGNSCAVFTADIAAMGDPANPLQVQARGNVVIELNTCRTLEATLTGPLSLVSVEQETQYSATGDLLLAIRSQYGASK